MAAALVFGAYGVLLLVIVAPVVMAGKADRLLDKLLGPLEDEQARRAHYARCDAHARRPGYIEIPPSASRRGAA